LSHPHYAFPARLVLEVSGALALGKTRSFREDAVRCLQRLSPSMDVRGMENILPCGPFLLTVNHYRRPGFNAGWIALAASAAVPVELHWIITSAWTFPGRTLALPLRKITEFVFRRLALVYGFTRMPPMPPAPNEVQARAQAVRRALDYARRATDPAIGLAPEGRDTPGGVLCSPPPGVGRFAALLASHCLQISPVGVFEESGRLVIQFGAPYALILTAGLDREQQDQHASRVLMSAIAAQLPTRLRGEFG
jgi:hypothetical protein